MLRLRLINLATLRLLATGLLLCVVLVATCAGQPVEPSATVQNVTVANPLSESALANRLLLTGTTTVTMLLWMATFYGYLRVDHATRGFYSGRLQTLAIVIGLTVLLGAIVFYLVRMRV